MQLELNPWAGWASDDHDAFFIYIEPESGGLQQIIEYCVERFEYQICLFEYWS